MHLSTNKQRGVVSVQNIGIALLLFFAGIMFNRAYTEARYQVSVSDLQDEKSFALFLNVWQTLEEKYSFEQPSTEEKMYGAIQGLTRSYGDDYTTFLPPQEAQFFNDNVAGEFGGIGAEVNLVKGLLVVVAPLEGSPAQTSGLKSGDIILSVDEVDVVGMTLDEAINLIRGTVGTEVVLEVVREGEGEPLSVSITRDTVVIPILDTEIIDGVFVIHLYNFNEASAREFKKAITEFRDSGATKLLIDLRNNPGGYLEASTDIASYFLPQGKVIVTEDFGNSETKDIVYRSTGHSLLADLEYEAAVLVNYGSASASEILAAALDDHKRALILGEPTFGKGSVQELLQLPDNTALKVTIAKWLTPNGTHIDEEGIIPDIVIEESEDESLLDTQLQQAIDYLNKTTNE